MNDTRVWIVAVAVLALPAAFSAAPPVAPGATAWPGAAASSGAAVPAHRPSTGALARAFAEADTAAYLQELDRLLYEDLVASLPRDRWPERPPCDVALLRRSLSVTSAVVAFLPDGDTVWAAVLAREGVHPRALDAPHTNALGPRLASWAAGERSYDPHAASVLYNNLFPPLRDVLSRKQHLIIAAGGVLRSIPFDALLLAPAENVAERDRPFLVERYLVAHEATLGSRLGWSSRPGELQRLRRSPGAPDAGQEGARPGSGSAPEPGGAPPAAPGSGGSGAPLNLPIADGTLPAVAGRPVEGDAVESLRWIRKGARGVLLGGSEEGMDAFLRLYFRERAALVRPDVQTVHRVRSALAREGAPVEAWAWPRLFGAE